MYGVFNTSVSAAALKSYVYSADTHTWESPTGTPASIGMGTVVPLRFERYTPAACACFVLASPLSLLVRSIENSNDHFFLVATLLHAGAPAEPKPAAGGKKRAVVDGKEASKERRPAVAESKKCARTRAHVHARRGPDRPRSRSQEESQGRRELSWHGQFNSHHAKRTSRARSKPDVRGVAACGVSPPKRAPVQPPSASISQRNRRSVSFAAALLSERGSAYNHYLFFDRVHF